MKNKKRFWALCFLILAMIGLLFLSSGLTTVSLNSEWGLADFGSPDGRRIVDSSATSLLDRLPSLSASLLRLVFMSTILVVPVTLFFALFSAEIRKALMDELKKILPFVIWMITLFYLLQRLQLNRNLKPTGRQAGTVGGPPGWITNPTALIAFLIGAILLLALSGAGWYVWRRTRPSKLERIARQAQQTLDQLQAGHSFKNAIIGCYYRMCRLQSEQRIERGRSMTPREFVARLQDLGIGGEEVQRLTALFEAVRYGAQPPSQAEEREAIECLNALVEAAREPSDIHTLDTIVPHLTKHSSEASEMSW